ncbi:vWA domain-containing protein [Sorangium sp. So ce726]|uniref:vWA domain-containing protein n=1 Tax=Sorangium sp. So ce726 TaxID=3133319 RepID=UPI003F63BABD
MSSTLNFPRLSVLLALLATGVALSCGGKNDGDSSSQGSGGIGGSGGSGGSGGAGDGGAAPGSGSGSTVGEGGSGLDFAGSHSSSGMGGGGGACQQLDITFEPQTPTVMIVVDRSGSMYGSGFWNPLKTAVLNVVDRLQDRVRFGFVTFTGIENRQCPLLARADGIAINHHTAISAAYDEASTVPPGKLETPTAMTFNETIVPELLAFPEPGPKYILFVTDGEPDRCDDVLAVCARDDVVGAVQDAYEQGIGTFVFGLGSGALAQHLQDVANAGAGQPVQRPRSGTNEDCFAGAGTYESVGGTATYYTPNPTDASSLEDELNAAIAGVKSCTFDLQGSIEVDLRNASLGQVLLDGTPVPYDAQNGWTMESATRLVLVGDACEQLKDAQEISFDFPCEILVPQ